MPNINLNRIGSIPSRRAFNIKRFLKVVGVTCILGVTIYAHQPKKSKYPKTIKLTSPDENGQCF